MRIRIDKRTIDYWMKHLTRAGLREIGGVLFGEQLGEGYFRIVEATRQRSGIGTYNRFLRRGAKARKKIMALHRRYSGQPERFNYLGEWHSHPNALALPSTRDEMTMTQLLEDQAGAVNFLVLVVVRISQAGTLEICAQAYLTSGHVVPCEVEVEKRIRDHDD